MANVKITELTAATALAGTDVLPIVDVGADATKKVSVSDLLRNLPDGTASAPALAFADDQNTGVLSPGDNSLAFATSGTQQLVIDSNGNVGVAETSPSTHSAGSGLPTLVLKGNSGSLTDRSGAIAFVSQDGGSTGKTWMYHDTDFYIQSTTATNIRFFTNNSERLRIASSGNVAIGNSSPDRLLHLSGADTAIIRLENTDTSLTADQIIGGLEFEKQDGSGAGAGVVGGLRMYSEGSIGESAYLTLSTASSSTNNAERLRVDSSGNVKIPAGSFDLRVGDNIDSNAGSQTISVGSVSSGSGGIGIFANPTNGNSFIQFGDGSASADQYRGYLNYQHASDALTFGSAGSERMRINSSGNVGIGNTNPSQPLDVTGWVKTSVGLLGTYGRVGLGDSGGPEFTTGALANPIKFIGGNGSSNLERMRIDGLGNVGIGTTSVDTRLHVANSGSVPEKLECTGGTSCYLKYENTDNARGYVGYEGKRLVFYADNGSNTGDIRVAFMDADGLKFGSDTAAANALHDYEEGTWTATVRTTNNDQTISAGNTTGYYVKVGSMVTAYYYSAVLNISAAGSGGAAVYGLPFTVANLTHGYTVGTVTHATCFANQVQNCYADPNQNRVVFIREGTVSASSFTTGSSLYLMVTITYRAG
jgi:hypothetical protein